MVFESSSKSRKSLNRRRNAFQIFEAADENDLEVAMVVLRGGTHIDTDEEERSARAGEYRGIRDVR